MSKTVGTSLHFDIGLTRVVRLHLHHLATRGRTYLHCKTGITFHYCMRNRRCKRTHQNRCSSDPVNKFAIAECHDDKILSENASGARRPLIAYPSIKQLRRTTSISCINKALAGRRQNELSSKGCGDSHYCSSDEYSIPVTPSRKY